MAQDSNTSLLRDPPPRDPASGKDAPVSLLPSALVFLSSSYVNLDLDDKSIIGTRLLHLETLERNLQ
jgi:hypothetical protein